MLGWPLRPQYGPLAQGLAQKTPFSRTRPTTEGFAALSMAMPFVANDYVALALMGIALFGNQWVAATYIGTVGDVVPHEVAGRVAHGQPNRQRPSRPWPRAMGNGAHRPPTVTACSTSP